MVQRLQALPFCSQAIFSLRCTTCCWSLYNDCFCNTLIRWRLAQLSPASTKRLAPSCFLLFSYCCISGPKQARDLHQHSSTLYPHNLLFPVFSSTLWELLPHCVHIDQRIQQSDKNYTLSRNTKSMRL